MKPRLIFMAAALILLAFAMISCSPKVVTIEKPVIIRSADSIFRNAASADIRVERDSFILHERGDTVFISDIKWRTKEISRTDTVTMIKYIERPVTVTVEKTTERKLTLWQNVKINTFWPLLIILLLLIAFLSYRTDKIR